MPPNLWVLLWQLEHTNTFRNSGKAFWEGNTSKQAISRVLLSPSRYQPGSSQDRGEGPDPAATSPARGKT